MVTVVANPRDDEPTVARIWDFQAEQNRFAVLEKASKDRIAALKRAAQAKKTKVAKARPDKLTGLIEGSQITLSRPGAVGSYEARWTFQRDGTIVGAAFQSQSDYEVTVNDRGQWWVTSGSLCIKWNKWDSKETRCYAIAKVDGRHNSYMAFGRKGLLVGDFILEK